MLPCIVPIKSELDRYYSHPKCTLGGVEFYTPAQNYMQPFLLPDDALHEIYSQFVN